VNPTFGSFQDSFVDYLLAGLEYQDKKIKTFRIYVSFYSLFGSF
jgi:hypothetical protein